MRALASTKQTLTTASKPAGNLLAKKGENMNYRITIKLKGSYSVTFRLVIKLIAWMKQIVPGKNRETGNRRARKLVLLPVTLFYHNLHSKKEDSWPKKRVSPAGGE